MSQAPNFRVRFALGLAVTLCVLGPALLAIGVLTSNLMSGALGAMECAIGIAMLRVPFIVIVGPQMALRNLLGMTLRRVVVADDHGSPLGFALEKDGRLLRWQDPAGKARPVKISKFSSRTEDFDALAAWVRTGVLG